MIRLLGIACTLNKVLCHCSAFAKLDQRYGNSKAGIQLNNGFPWLQGQAEVPRNAQNCRAQRTNGNGARASEGRTRLAAARLP